MIPRRVEQIVLLHANKVLELKFTKWPRGNGSQLIFKNQKTTKFLEYVCPYDQLLHSDSAKQGVDYLTLPLSTGSIRLERLAHDARAWNDG